MNVEFFLTCFVAAILLTSSCNSPEIRKEHKETSLAVVRPLSDGGISQPDLQSKDDIQSESQAAVDPSEVGVTFRINPARARLEIDGKVVPARGVLPRPRYLTRSSHEVKVVDESNEYPPLTQTIIVDQSHREFDLDLAKNFGLLRIKSQQPVQFSVIVDDRKFPGIGPHRLWPGDKVLLFEPATPCYQISPDTPRRVNIAAGITQTVEVKWTVAPDDILLIQPKLREGRDLFDAVDAIVKLDDKEVSSSDGGTAYRIACGVQRIEVKKQGYGSASLIVHSAEYKRLRGRTWTPELEEQQMSGIHVDCHEVTVRDYGEYIAAKNPRLLPRAEDPISHNWHFNNREKRARHPVNAISYEAAKEYCEWRAKEKGLALDGRVATVQDFRAITGYATNRYIYPWGYSPAPSCERAIMRQFPNRDGCGDSPRGTTAPVCSKPQGKARFGHCDILGNVAEWVSPGKVFGGGFRDGIENQRFSMAADPAPPRINLLASDNVGFRCAWPLKSSERCSCKEANVDHSEH